MDFRPVVPHDILIFFTCPNCRLMILSVFLVIDKSYLRRYFSILLYVLKFYHTVHECRKFNTKLKINAQLATHRNTFIYLHSFSVTSIQFGFFGQLRFRLSRHVYTTSCSVKVSLCNDIVYFNFLSFQVIACVLLTTTTAVQTIYIVVRTDIYVPLGPVSQQRKYHLDILSKILISKLMPNYHS